MFFLHCFEYYVEYHYYHYDKDYLRRLELEKEEKERKEQYERDEIKYREFIEQKRKEILMRMFPYDNINNIDPGYLEILEVIGTLPKLPL